MPPVEGRRGMFEGPESVIGGRYCSKINAGACSRCGSQSLDYPLLLLL